MHGVNELGRRVLCCNDPVAIREMHFYCVGVLTYWSCSVLYLMFLMYSDVSFDEYYDFSKHTLSNRDTLVYGMCVARCGF